MGRECQLCSRLSLLAEKEQVILWTHCVSSLPFPSHIRYLIAWDSECVHTVLCRIACSPSQST